MRKLAPLLLLRHARAQGLLTSYTTMVVREGKTFASNLLLCLELLVLVGVHGLSPIAAAAHLAEQPHGAPSRSAAAAVAQQQLAAGGEPRRGRRGKQEGWAATN